MSPAACSCPRKSKKTKQTVGGRKQIALFPYYRLKTKEKKQGFSQEVSGRIGY